VPSVIIKVPPGTYSNAERSRSVHVTSDGIVSTKLEAGAVLFYKTARGFARLDISE
jgi:hypothetical protein